MISDGETWAGETHTNQALERYRKASGRDSKLIVENMVSYTHTLADPEDAGQLNIVGFDASVPTIIRDFIGAKENTETESND